jgi:predicted nucleic acid-binding Zn ribbon protein
MNWNDDEDDALEDWPDDEAGLDDDVMEDEDEPVVPCPHCGTDVHEDSVRCPVCGDYITTTPQRPWSTKPVWLQRLAVILLVLTLLGFVAIELRHWLGVPLPDPTGTLREGD